MWLKRLKIAIVEKDIQKIEELVENISELEDDKSREEALYLLKAASELIVTLKENTRTSMVQMKKNIDFLKSTEQNPTSNFDVTS